MTEPSERYILSEEQRGFSLEDLLKNSEDFISLVDHNHYYCAASRKYYDFFVPSSMSSIVGKHVSEVHDKHIYTSHTKQLLDSCLAGEYLHSRYWIKSPNTSEWIFIDSSMKPFRNDKGEILGVFIVARNFTDFFTSEARFRQFTNNAADFFWELDKDSNAVFVSDGIEADIGIDIQTLLTIKTHKNQNNLNKQGSAKTIAAYIESQKVIKNREIVLGDGNSGHRYFSVNGSPFYDNNKEYQGFRCTLTEITEQKLLLKKISHIARYDNITGLLNRNEFEQQVRVILKQHSKEIDNNVSINRYLCYIDLDHFKLINDTQGHAFGDEVLKNIGGLLEASTPVGDICARLGGDEFGLFLYMENDGKALEFCRRLIDKIINMRIYRQGRWYNLGASIGLIKAEEDDDDFDLLLSNADIACYSAKDKGRNQAVLFHKEAGIAQQRKKQTDYLAFLHQALDDKKFGLAWQGIYAADSNKLNHYEIFVRMFDNDDIVIQPKDFIPLAERTGLIRTIDLWVIKTAFAHAQKISAQSRAVFSINVSAQTFGWEKFSDFVLSSMNQSALEPHNICFEITESSAIGNLKHAQRCMRGLREKGFLFALDDFGSGLCSFSHLKNLPVDYLKIDGSLIKNIEHNPQDLAIIEAINKIGHTLEMKTVAEYVSNDQILNKVKELGIDYAQGFILDKPKLMKLDNNKENNKKAG